MEIKARRFAADIGESPHSCGAPAVFARTTRSIETLVSVPFRAGLRGFGECNAFGHCASGSYQSPQRQSDRQRYVMDPHR